MGLLYIGAIDLAVRRNVGVHHDLAAAGQCHRGGQCQDGLAGTHGEVGTNAHAGPGQGFAQLGSGHVADVDRGAGTHQQLRAEVAGHAVDLHIGRVHKHGTALSLELTDLHGAVEHIDLGARVHSQSVDGVLGARTGHTAVGVERTGDIGFRQGQALIPRVSGKAHVQGVICSDLGLGGQRLAVLVDDARVSLIATRGGGHLQGNSIGSSGTSNLQALGRDAITVGLNG